jgi:ATP-dependent helicase/DNAse subunit B
MKRLIKKILKEDRRQMFLDKIIKVMKNDFPLFKNLKDYGFTEQLSRNNYRKKN